MITMPAFSTSSNFSAETCSATPDFPRALSRRDLGNYFLVAGQRDFVPEFLHHLGRLADANRRADLRGVAAEACRPLHIYDVALLQPAARRPRVAQNLRRIRH